MSLNELKTGGKSNQDRLIISEQLFSSPTIGCNKSSVSEPNIAEPVLRLLFENHRFVRGILKVRGVENIKASRH